MRAFSSGFGSACLTIAIVISLAITPVYADDLDASRAKLDTLQRQIEQTLQGLRSKQSEGGSVTDALERLDGETRRIARQQEQSRRRLSALTRQTEQKRNELKLLRQRMSAIEGQVRARLVALYKSGEVGMLRVLLSSAGSPAAIAEKYAFLSRMVRHDRELLDSYREQGASLRATLSDLDALQQKQAAVVERRRREKQLLAAAKREKKSLLAAINKDAELLEAALQELRARAGRLNDLVKKLETEQSQTYTGALEGLEPGKGRLTWPVDGAVRTAFGPQRHGSLGTLIESHGFDIEAPVGTPIRAVAPGRVIFAKPLRGYGKLLILDHGDKYYTLYAHVARFNKEQGEIVAAAETIGYSGFEGRDAVYFEIRRGGKPLDPANWLASR
jgi:septal ring factor EnvC (AmiA/AmiB activator)